MKIFNEHSRQFILWIALGVVAVLEFVIALIIVSLFLMNAEPHFYTTNVEYLHGQCKTYYVQLPVKDVEPVYVSIHVCP